MPRRIGIVTVARSDRGHLDPLIQALGDQAVVVQWPDLYDIYDPMCVGVPRADLVVILGDRWEMAAAAAHVMGKCIPIAHLHAGETTEAVIDDQCRAAISAMATWHIAAAEPYAAKLRAQGYTRVQCLGAPGLARLKPSTNRYSSVTGILVQFHPETKHLADVPRQVAELKAALEPFWEACTFTEPGMDAGRQDILAGLGADFQTFTDDEWLDKLAFANVLVGNSSCGIIETPSIPLPSVNIGDRQKGRLMASSVINAPHDREAIEAGIRVALNPLWRANHLTGVNPYGDRGAAQRIAEFLRTCAI